MDYLLVAKVVLCLAGAGALVYLALLLKKTMVVMERITETIRRNEKDVDVAITNVNKLIESTNTLVVETAKTVETANRLITEIEPDVMSITNNVNGITESVNKMSESVNETTSVITGVVNTTTEGLLALSGKVSGNLNSAKTALHDNVGLFTDSVSTNFSKFFDYFFLAKEIVLGLISKFKKA